MDGYSEEEVGYHALLLIEAGLAEGQKTTGAGLSPRGFISRLTWQGHEFLDAAQDDTRWAKAQSMVKEHAGSVTMEVLKELLTRLMKTSLGLPS